MTEFRGLVTNEAISQARLAKQTPGWYIVPKEFRIFDTAGQFIATRTISGLGNGWYHHDFNAITIEQLGANKLLYTVTIPGDAYATSKQIGEICFIAQTAEASPTEYLYVIIQPTTTMTFEPDVTLKMYFTITLNNTNVAEIYYIDISKPEDVEEHNMDELSHSILFGRKAGVDLDNLSADGNQKLVPVGTVIWFAKNTAPAGYLPCNGAAVSRTDYESLFNVIGTTFNGSTTTAATEFRVPKLTDGRFIEGSTTVGTYHKASLPKHTHTTTVRGGTDVLGGPYSIQIGKNGDQNLTSSNPSYQAGTDIEQTTTVRPKSLTLLPCIKY